MIVIYVKTTNRCQLQCKHCYNTISPFKGDISETVIKETIDLINKKSQEDKVLVIFHGGEPVASGLKPLQDITNALKDNPNVNITITTNLVYTITPEHIELFKHFTNTDGKPLISTSWDYKIRFKDKQEDLWRSNVKMLIKQGFNVAPIVCVTKDLIENIKPEDLYNDFKSLGITRMNFERLTLTGRAEDGMLKPLNRDVDKWLYDAYKYRGNLIISLFTSLEESILKNHKVGCRARHCQRNVITINPNGTIAGCPNCSNKIYAMTNGFYNQKKFESLCSEEEIKNNECYMCELYEYCNGDCFQLKSDESGCPGLKLIIKDILQQ